jgi:hypothetical protein
LYNTFLDIMEHQPRVLSAGEHPIHLYEIDVVSAKAIPHVAVAEAEGSQAGTEYHGGSALSSPSDEVLSHSRFGEDEIESSPAVLSLQRELSGTLGFKRRNNTAGQRNRNLDHHLVSNAHTSSNGDPSDEGLDSFGKTESGFDSSPSSPSSGSEDTESDGDLQVAQAGQQFEDGTVHNADVAEHSDIDLDEVVSGPLLDFLLVRDLILFRNNLLVKPARPLLRPSETAAYRIYREPL